MATKRVSKKSSKRSSKKTSKKTASKKSRSKATRKAMRPKQSKSRSRKSSKKSKRSTVSSTIFSTLVDKMIKRSYSLVTNRVLTAAELAAHINRAAKTNYTGAQISHRASTLNVSGGTAESALSLVRNVFEDDSDADTALQSWVEGDLVDIWKEGPKPKSVTIRTLQPA